MIASLFSSTARTISNPQFQANVTNASVVAAATYITSSALSSGHTAIAHQLSGNPVDIHAVNVAHDQGSIFLNNNQHKEAAESFKKAKVGFENKLMHLANSNEELKNRYYRICYNEAFATVCNGQLDAALTAITLLENKLLQWDIAIDADLFHLKAIIYLKQENYQQANETFTLSLTLAENPDITLLQKFAEINLLDKNNEVYRQGMQYILNSNLFNLDKIHPIIFEINLAIIKMMFELGDYDTCYKNLDALERQSTQVALRFVDKKRIYEFAITVLTKLQNKNSEQECMQHTALGQSDSSSTALDIKLIDVYKNKLSIEKKAYDRQNTHTPEPTHTRRNKHSFFTKTNLALLGAGSLLLAAATTVTAVAFKSPSKSSRSSI